MGSTTSKTPENPQVLVKDNFLLAIVPPAGYRAEWGAILGFLKVAGGAVMRTERSELEFLNVKRETVEVRDDAFGLKSQTILTGPYSERFADDSRRPESAVLARWRINDTEIETSLAEPEGTALRVIYLPLQVAKEKDPHIVFTLINRGGEMLNIADGIREAVCRADATPYRSNTGGHWDGSYRLRPGHATTRQLNLDDFPGIPRSGRHEMSLEILGVTSEPAMIDWRGQPE
jgi:hypothetical protein